MDVSTDYLKTFVAVSECKSFSLAASRVHKSQGAISTQIAKLEEQARIQLIDRSQRNFKLTEAGEVFLVFARETLARADEIGKLFDELNSGIKGEVKIGATRSVGIYVLPDIMSAIAHEFPRLKLSLFTQSRVPTYEQLKKGELDLAVVLSDSSPGGLVTKPLRVRAAVLCCLSPPSLGGEKNRLSQRIEFNAVCHWHQRQRILRYGGQYSRAKRYSETNRRIHD